MKLSNKKIVEILKLLLDVDNIEVIKCAIESLIDRLEENDKQEHE